MDAQRDGRPVPYTVSGMVGVIFGAVHDPQRAGLEISPYSDKIGAVDDPQAGRGTRPLRRERTLFVERTSPVTG